MMSIINLHSVLTLVASCLLFVCCKTKSNEGKQGMIDQLITNFTTNENSMKYILDKWIAEDKK